MAGIITGAGIVSGRLILSLDDGSIIDVGYVQGQQGLKGDRGGIGSVGPKGQDGRTIHHGTGFPTMSDPATAVDGDFFYSTDKIALFGPRTGGQWGKPVYLRPQDNKSFTLPTGMKSQGSRSGGRAFAAAMGGAGGGTVVTGGSGGDGLQTIIPHNKALAAGAPVIDPVTSTVTTPAVWTDVAIDPQVGGDAFIVDIDAEGPAGAMLIEVAVMRDQAKRTGYSQVYEVKTGTPPILTFDAYNAPNGNLALRMYSSENLVNIRGRILFI